VFDELQRSRVHAVAQASGLRSIREDMAQVGIALAAERFGAHHPQAGIGFLSYILFGDRRPKARPAGTGIKLGVGAEKRVAAAHTAVDAWIVQLVILAGEGHLGTLLARDRKLIGSELALPFFVALDYFFSCHNSHPHS
jgi:hypothetical protein